MHNLTTLLIGILVFAAAPLSRSLIAQDQSKAARSPAAEVAIQFLGHLDKGDTAAALGLWDSPAVNEKVTARLGKIASKVKKLGGIKRIDIGPCEARRINKHEQATGEKIDVIPVEIISGDKSLILAVLSMRHKGGAWRVFHLESLKEWGGTASLDEEMAYSN